MKATRIRVLAPLAVLGVLCAGAAFAQQPPPAPAAQATVASPTRVFGSNTGVVLNFIKADKTADFEAVVAKLKEALHSSPNATRQEQAASWNVYKSPDPGPAGSVLYIFIIDPVVKGADYAVATILAEGFSGDEFSALVKKYTEAYATGQNFVNLSLVSELGK
jgi:hypothetical protein